MIGMIADLPVRDAPLMMLTAPRVNSNRRGFFDVSLGQRMISLI